MTPGKLPVLAVVIATRGGRLLAAALDSVAWAAERAVLDATGEPGSELPQGVRLGRDAARIDALGSAPWLLLLAEHEVAPASLRDHVARVVEQGGAGARRIGVEVETLGAHLVPRYAPVRLAPRAGSRLVLERGLTLGLAARGGRGERLDVRLRAAHGASVEEAVDALGAESRALAVLLAQDARAAGVARIGVCAMAAAARLLLARAPARAGLARWLAVVFAGYRVVLAHTRAWEWRRAQPVSLREVA